ncbi:MAG: UDP-3-O-acyl-N-acetylglucosamine deacetylase [Elusimicrobia bacterium]|nr:UDP-3-O-acyl-N-acetylglucosamine deacetylase [Elusimicrobiota bacterium]
MIIEKEISLSGVGIHTGEKVEIIFKPAPEGKGINFYRTDIKNSPAVKAALHNVSSTERGVNLSADGVEIFTVEHVLSACAGLEIADIDIFLNAPEPPAMDGSAMAFAKALLEMGITGGRQAKILSIDKEVEYNDGDAMYCAEPSDKLSFDVLFLNENKFAANQRAQFDFSQKTFMSEIAPARTFCFEEEIENLKKAGLAKGGSLENAVVIAKNGFKTSSGGLRFDNEMARHKLLDLIGDLSLTGLRLGNMRIRAAGGGHKRNIKFAQFIMTQGTLQ